MDIEKKAIETNDEPTNTYDFEGYTIVIEYTPGRTMYQCMESAIKRMNEKLTYNVI